MIAFCRARKIDLVVVGPEAPLRRHRGRSRRGRHQGVRAGRAAARLEGSKGFTKDLCKANGIPTAAYERFTAAAPAKAYVRAQGAPIVVKADGLAAGKGVVVAPSIAEAEAAIDMMFGGGLGEAGAEVVVEEFLKARRLRSSRSATARPPSRSPRRRTTSASSTATKARTPAAWAPIRRRR